MENEIDNFLKLALEKKNATIPPSLPRKRLVRDGGAKFLRIVVEDDVEGDVYKHTSAYCFIALEDGANRTLGPWKKGDYFKCAGYKAPAKGARGNIFDADPVAGINSYGPVYLK